MKLISNLVLISMVLSSSAFASTCETTKLSKLDFIQAIASSEALSNLKGPRRDVSKIEVFAVSDAGLNARANITFADSNQVITVKAAINCDAGGILELE